MNRRELSSHLFTPFRAGTRTLASQLNAPTAPPPPAPPQVATIMARYCLPYEGTPCSVCSDRCPIAGAIIRDEDNLPRVDPAVCTGCGLCSDACPPPVRALRFDPKRDPRLDA